MKQLQFQLGAIFENPDECLYEKTFENSSPDGTVLNEVSENIEIVKSSETCELLTVIQWSSLVTEKQKSG